jgi:DNA polymerase-3 subunit gamma/tau
MGKRTATIRPPKDEDASEPQVTEPEKNAEYQVVARRYRPQQLADLVGQEPVAKALTNALESNRVAHAYLFTGARGVGKTSTARILAKALNCEKGPTPQPCDVCEICRGITSGDDIDVLEIDGASNRGIDEVRAIRQNVQTRPARARYKIYIIDEVHMLTQQAFNALLKTLEEPPPHVKFIFATTEVQKIPITILSRCQRFDFASITSSRIAQRLKQIVETEGMLADDDALHFIARRAGGSMRDAQSLLDQLLAFSNQRLTLDRIHSLLGTAPDERVTALVERILIHDVKGALNIVTTAAEDGLQPGELLDQLIEYWRGLMLANCSGPASGFDLPVAVGNRETLLAQAMTLQIDTILAGLDILTTTKSRMRGSSHAWVLLEMAVVRLSRLDEIVPLVQLAKLIAQAGLNPTTPATSKPSTPPPESKKKTDVAVNGTPQNHSLTNGSAANTASPADFSKTWEKVLQQVGILLSEGLKRAGCPIITGANTLVLTFPVSYKKEYETCSQKLNRQRLEYALQEVTGTPWTTRIELQAEVATPELEQPRQTPAAPRLSGRQLEEKLKELPLIKRAVEVMSAVLLKADEGFDITQKKTPPATPQVFEETDLPEE